MAVQNEGCLDNDIPIPSSIPAAISRIPYGILKAHRYAHSPSKHRRLHVITNILGFLISTKLIGISRSATRHRNSTTVTLNLTQITPSVHISLQAVPLTLASRGSALHANNLATTGQFTAIAALWADELVAVAAQTEGFDNVLAKRVSGLDHIVTLFCL